MYIHEIPINGSRASLSLYALSGSHEMANAKTRPLVLVFPGGGYSMCSDREAEPIALAFAAEGYHAAVLRYTTGDGALWPEPLEDAEAAMAWLHEHHEAYGIDCQRIGVIGFSAGGHLAAMLATAGIIKPQALILGYPCIMEEIGKVLRFNVPGAEKQVSGATPPTFIFSTVNDPLVPIRHSIAFQEALLEAKVPFESHFFQVGSHGLSLAKAHTSGGLKDMVNPRVAKWFELCTGWLTEQFGSFASDLQIQAYGVNDSGEGYDVDCSIGKLRTDTRIWGKVLQYLPILNDEQTYNQSKGISLRMLQQYAGDLFTIEAMEQLDKAFKSEVSYAD